METVVQSVLILILMILVILLMSEIGRLQGTARVINYAGLVRGATQREVKLEITGYQNDELIEYLDDILNGLKYGDGNYNLITLDAGGPPSRIPHVPSGRAPALCVPPYYRPIPSVRSCHIRIPPLFRHGTWLSSHVPWRRMYRSWSVLRGGLCVSPFRIRPCGMCALCLRSPFPT